jgi:hypothetical protein
MVVRLSVSPAMALFFNWTSGDYQVCFAVRRSLARPTLNADLRRLGRDRLGPLGYVVEEVIPEIMQRGCALCAFWL